jgi:hypothetical protein
MTDCRQAVFEFQGHYGRKVTSDFTGGYLSGDGGGAVLLRELDLKLGLMDRMAGCFTDLRDQRYVEHTLPELLRQRIGALALGYEDLNDHDDPRHDPAHALMAGRKDIEGMDRACERDRGKALAAHSTLNRMELGCLGTDGRYKKIIADADKLEALLIEEGVKAIPRKSRRIVLDFDATDDPLHGAQEGAFFHGYYGEYCYLPLYCFCGSIPVWAQLRDAQRDAGEGTVRALEKIVTAVRRRFGRKVRIVVRADSGFAREAIMVWCEQHQVNYCLGLARNNRLQESLAEAFENLRQQLECGAIRLPCRSYLDFQYTTLDSWSRKRRVVGKAEILEKGDNPRFIVTDLPGSEWEARSLYEDFYCARGDMENRIKEQQLDLFADRTSTGWMASNQLRLWFSAFAHLMLSRLRAEVLKGTALAQATLGTIRLKLFKIAARVRVSCRRIHLELSGACPYRDTFARVWANLTAWSP